MKRLVLALSTTGLLAGLTACGAAPTGGADAELAYQKAAASTFSTSRELASNLTETVFKDGDKEVGVCYRVADEAQSCMPFNPEAPQITAVDIKDADDEAFYLLKDADSRPVIYCHEYGYEAKYSSKHFSCYRA